MLADFKQTETLVKHSSQPPRQMQSQVLTAWIFFIVVILFSDKQELCHIDLNSLFTLDLNQDSRMR